MDIIVKSTRESKYTSNIGIIPKKSKEIYINLEE